jgi:hypothetical protein
MEGMRNYSVTADPPCNPQRKLYLCEGAEETLRQHDNNQLFSINMATATTAAQT